MSHKTIDPLRALARGLVLLLAVLVALPALAQAPPKKCRPGDPLCDAIDDRPKPPPPPPKPPPPPPPPPTAKPPAPPPAPTPTPPPPPTNYKETKDARDPENTQVTFEADVVDGKGAGPDSIRLVVRPRGPDIACLGRFNDIADRELSPLTLRYALRATLRCMNPCFTDDDLDFLTSCDDWEAMYRRMKKLRGPSAAAPPKPKVEGEEEKAPEPEADDGDDDPINAFLKQPAGCADTAVTKAKAEGRLSGRVKDDKSGRCASTNPNYKPQAFGPPSFQLGGPPPIADTYTPSEAQLEFNKFKTSSEGAFIMQRETRFDTRVGGMAELRWHFAGPIHARVHAGAIGDRFIAGVRLAKSPSKHELTLVGSVLPLEQGALKSEFSLGDVGLGIPNTTGASAIVVAPITYFRDEVNKYAGFQSNLGAWTEQNVGSRITLLAAGRVGLAYAAAPATSDPANEVEQSGMGSFVSTSAGAKLNFGDVADTNNRLLPYLKLVGQYDRHVVNVGPKPGSATAAASPSPGLQSIGIEAWTATLALGARF